MCAHVGVGGLSNGVCTLVVGSATMKRCVWWAVVRIEQGVCMHVLLTGDDEALYGVGSCED